MAAILNAIFRMTDNISSGLNNIADTGETVLSNLENTCKKVDSSLNQASRNTLQTATSLSKLSGEVSGVVSESRLLAKAMSDEAEKMNKAALNAQIKADMSERVAAAARKHYNELLKEIDSTDNATDAMKEHAKAALEEAERLEKAAESARKKANSAEKSANAARENAQAVTAAAQAEEKLYTSASKTAKAEEKVADALNKSEQQAEEYGEAARRAASQSDELGTNGANAGELLQEAFATLGIATAIRKIEEAFVAAASASIEFESAITGVYKTVDGTERQLEIISDDIKDMSLVMPATTTEIAGVAEAAGQLGIGTKYITDFTEVMINLGESTNMASTEAASSLAKFSNITNMAETEYENLGSTVVALGNNFATTEADIVSMGTRMASAGTLAGFTESEILGLAAAISSVGIEAEAGGSAMSKLMTDIQVAVETGNDSLTDFANVAGMTREQFTNLFQGSAADALYAFIDGLNDVERNGQTATVILENMGITEVRLSNAVKSLANNSEGLANAVDLAGVAWEENTALATEAGLRYDTLESKIGMTKNAANNLKIAIGDDLTPVIEAFADAGTDALTWLTGFVEENPAVTATITGLSVALGVGTIAIGGYSVATKVAIPVTKAFTAALKANPIIQGISIATGVIALISGITAAIGVMESGTETVEEYNGTLEKCRTEIQQTEIAYANVCKMYGENSEVAKQLASDLDTLNAQYEKGGGYAAELEQKVTELSESYHTLQDDIQAAYDSISDSEQSGMVAIAQLDALSQKAELTNTDLDLMTKYADYLNDTFNCNIEVNYDTGELTGFNPETLTDKVIQIAQEQRIEVSLNTLSSMEAQSAYTEAYKTYNEALEKLAPLKSRYDALMKPNSDGSGQVGSNQDLNNLAKEFGGTVDDMISAFDSLEEAESEYFKQDALFKEHAYIVDETGLTYESLTDSLKKVATASETASESSEKLSETLSYQQVVSNIWNSNIEEINALTQAYEEAYESIRADLDGLFGIFEEAKMNFEETLNLDTAISNLETQIDYFNKYEEAVRKLSEIGLDNDVIAQLNPEQAVAFSTELANMNTETAKAKVDEINGAFDKLSQAKDKTAETMSDIETEFSKKLSEIETEVGNSIENMKLEGVAANAARVTMDGYISQLKLSGARAVSEAEAISKRISNALNSGSTSTSSQTSTSSSKIIPYTGSALDKTTKTTVVQANATGTTYSDDIYLAGDGGGPELIVGRKGSTVFPADETNRIISAIASDNEEKTVYIPPVEKRNDNIPALARDINLNINGQGSLNVQSNMSKTQIVEILCEHLKPVLMSIVAQEIFEEGEGYYET